MGLKLHSSGSGCLSMGYSVAISEWALHLNSRKNWRRYTVNTCMGGKWYGCLCATIRYCQKLFMINGQELLTRQNQHFFYSLHTLCRLNFMTLNVMSKNINNPSCKISIEAVVINVICLSFRINTENDKSEFMLFSIRE